MSNGQGLFVQFESDEFLALTTADREFIHNLKRSPRCNDAKHYECTIEVKKTEHDKEEDENPTNIGPGVTESYDD